MKVMVLVKSSPQCESGVSPSSEALTEMDKFNDELMNAGVFVEIGRLKPSAKGARVQFAGTQKSVIDGPFIESKELVGGFWIWEVKSLEDAIQWVKRCPNPHGDGKFEIELRPFAEPSDFAS